MDPRNHVFFSNRSASYAGLQNYTLASQDAKECIRLDPTFVKGYYRLVTAQIALKQYDAALSTIQQGLSVDAQNAQLLKQQRMVQQLKREQESKKKLDAPTDAKSNNGAAPASGMSSEFQELYTQYTQNKRAYETEKVNLSKLDREAKITQLTQADLETVPETQQCYRAVGKMFLATSKPNVVKHLQDSLEQTEKETTDAQKKLAYLEKKLTSQQQNLQELQQAQA